MIKYFKQASLVLLTVQSVGHILMMRYCRIRTNKLFFTSSLIIVIEIVKLLISIFISSYQIGLRNIYRETFMDPRDSAKVAIPAIIYVVQNNLLYISLSNLDSATFQVCYQLKLLTTAVFSVIMLKKSLSNMQWVSLLLLFVGVALVQLEPPSKETKIVAEGISQSRSVGITAVLGASLMSGFAGVYFEKISKVSKISLSVRNSHLAFIGVIISFFGQWFYESKEIRSKGFFYGFDEVIVLLIFLQSLGGLLVSVVVTYNSQLLKGFASSASIVISVCFSIFIFNSQITNLYFAGATLVIVSIIFYNFASPSLAMKLK